MSRIGRKPIVLPAGVTVEVSPGSVVVKGPKGSLSQAIHRDMQVQVQEGSVVVHRPSDQIRHKALHGLSRMLVYNMVQGVSQGFTKELELVGVGYRASVQGQTLDLSLGYSHNIIVQLSDEIKVSTKQEKGQNVVIVLEAADKQLLGLVASKIRSLRRPEPYKGKGVKYVDEVLRRKSGKVVGSK